LLHRRVTFRDATFVSDRADFRARNIKHAATLRQRSIGCCSQNERHLTAGRARLRLRAADAPQSRARLRLRAAEVITPQDSSHQAL
jgi:hypothetical protein